MKGQFDNIISSMPVFQNIRSRLNLITPDLIRRKPGFLLRVFYRSVLRKIGIDSKICSVLFHTHYRCNLRCTHCYEKNFTKTDRPLLSLEEKKKIISDCSDLGAYSFDFVSGESSLDKNLPELVKACRPNRTYITLATNGYNLSEQEIQYFHDIGIDKLNISLDSFFPDEHNSIRGKNDSHQNVLRTIDICKKIGMAFHITIFVYKGSTRSEGFKRLVEYAITNRMRATFKAAVPLGSFEGRHDSLITQDDRKTMFELHKKYPFLVRTCIGTSASTCPAFNRLITITAYGDVLPCNAVHISFGNISEEDLSGIISRGRKIPFFNGNYKGCPPSDDIDFIKKYLSRTYSAYPYPIKVDSVFTRHGNLLNENKSDTSYGV